MNEEVQEQGQQSRRKMKTEKVRKRGRKSDMTKEEVKKKSGENTTTLLFNCFNYLPASNVLRATQLTL